MIRVLLVIFAVLIAVLAFVLHEQWLYAASGVSLAGGLGLLGWHLWDQYHSRQQRARSREPTARAEESTDEFGISEVRPRDREEKNGTSDSGSGSSEPAISTSAGPSREDEARAETEGIEARSAQAHVDESVETKPRASSNPDERPVLGPFLESLRAALHAETVCLLVQEEVVLEYQIAGLASRQAQVRSTGSFGTEDPLLTATMSRQPVTVRALSGERALTNLGYYNSPPSIDHIAVAPVPQPDESSTVFLLADTTGDVDLGQSQARTLLTQFAEMVPLLLDLNEPSLKRSTEQQEGAEEGTESAAGEDEQPRPRRDIIAEEMEVADAAEETLALVLVHLNRAESIARRGDEAVQSAERRFQARLEQLAPGTRIERFGELTYGLFVHSDAREMETWAAELQDAMAEEAGELEGGVSVGVAVRGARHDAESLRADATEALREAYETGTCTIVA